MAKKSSPESRKGARRSPVRDTPPGLQTKRSVLQMRLTRLMGRGLFSLARLEQIEYELGRGAPIDEELRIEIRQLIAFVLSREAAKRGRGTPPDPTLASPARIVGALHQNHGIPVAEAARAMVPDPESEEGFNMARSIARAWRALKKHDGTFVASEPLVQKALARIRAGRKSRI